ncbi:MAG: two-component sensor histidine kinase [Desulfomonile tiedjei]|uniref:histidine kinase n=1 Tax=Desulfomonile tiedjei TaxID=2358 RepID=A0A9D6Z8S1_9BACT|nr:two-component sensor histidine kinase [Desulfomonile tiedjei]
MNSEKHEQNLLARFMGIPEIGGPQRYAIIRRTFIVLMLLITVLPLLLMTVINYHQYRTVIKDEIMTPQKSLVNKTKHSFEVFLANRLATVRFISSAYSYNDLADEKKLNRVFQVLKREFQGFVDLGLINSSGIQVSYVGPYDLKGKSYADQEWFEQVKVNGVYVSDVFMGYRRFPHLVIAVQHYSDSGEFWVVRATIETRSIDQLIAAMGLDPQSDAFFLNQNGTFQTTSKFYGKVLDSCSECVPPVSHEPAVIEWKDPQGKEVLLTYAYLTRPEFILVLAKPKAEVLKVWYALRGDLLLVFVISVGIIVVVVLRLTRVLVDRIQLSDEKRELAYREMQHSHKLSSIGRLAAGVAHEINNPMAIINEKAGLMKDIIELRPDFPEKPKFLGLVQSITQSVDRCRTITHRLLGFARRMEVEIEVLDVNDVVKETAGFLEKEALHRNIGLTLLLAPDLPRIASDRGQLQQVFLNILNNAFAAVKDGGLVSITTWEKDLDAIGVTFQDNGIGMSEETMKHIFEPFFTTKKNSGTGLGMSITYGIIKKLGGDIDIQSKPGEGTRLVVFLPKKPKEQTRELG